jgi:hypothetical protein
MTWGDGSTKICGDAMAHLTTENLLKILDRLVDRPSWKVVMRTIGASESLAFNWRMQSIKAAKENDRSSPFFLEWRNSWDFWHAHCGRARTENIILYESVIRDQAINGVEEVVHGPDQRVLYKEHPEYIGRDDDYIRIAEGLDAGASVAWYRLEHDADGKPIPLTKRTQLPAPVRLRVLEQDQRYVHKELHDVAVSGEITVARPLQRLPGEVRPDLARLKQLAAMSPEERRKALGATAVPKDAAGRRTLPVSAPRMDDKPDDAGHGSKPSPYAAPYQPPPAPEPQPKPSYARPNPSLDRGEGVGHGDPPPGGMRVA